MIQKSDETKKKIAARLNMAFMFQALDDKEKEIVIGAMGERKAKPGEYIIK